VKDGDVSYANYSMDELRQALASIDADRYPRNFANLRDALAARAAMPATEVDKLREDLVRGDATAQPEPPPRPESASHLWSTLALSAVLLGYGVHGLYRGSVDLPLRTRWHLEGKDLYFFVAFMVVAVGCNAMMLTSWMRQPSTEASLYRTGKGVGAVAVGLFIVFVIFHVGR
jgi:hypothetical protein